MAQLDRCAEARQRGAGRRNQAVSESRKGEKMKRYVVSHGGGLCTGVNGAIICMNGICEKLPYEYGYKQRRSALRYAEKKGGIVKELEIKEG